jgi:hypothetical protein
MQSFISIMEILVICFIKNSTIPTTQELDILPRPLQWSVVPLEKLSPLVAAGYFSNQGRGKRMILPVILSLSDAHL